MSEYKDIAKILIEGPFADDEKQDAGADRVGRDDGDTWQAPNGDIGGTIALTARSPTLLTSSSCQMVLLSVSVVTTTRWVATPLPMTVMIVLVTEHKPAVGVSEVTSGVLILAPDQI